MQGKSSGHEHTLPCWVQGPESIQDTPPATIPTSERQLQKHCPQDTCAQRFEREGSKNTIKYLLRDSQYFYRLLSLLRNTDTSEKTFPVMATQESTVVLSHPQLPWVLCNLKHSTSKLPLNSAIIIPVRAISISQLMLLTPQIIKNIIHKANQVLWKKTATRKKCYGVITGNILI